MIQPSEAIGFQLNGEIQTQPKMPTNTPLETVSLRSVALVFSDGSTLYFEPSQGQGVYKKNAYRTPTGKELITHEVFIADGS